MRTIRLTGYAAFLAVFGGIAGAQYDAQVSFNRDIRPIMSDTCFPCHGPDSSTRMAGLRLDIRDEALKPTRTKIIPIVPGKPEESAIIDRIFAKSKARLMPPVSAHKELTEQQKETIRRWVAEGAEYEGHWAYAPVQRTAPPAAAFPDTPARNPIDAFIQARLAREGLKPSREADRQTLIRRVTLDLTGLPPGPEEVEAFAKDKQADAYERLVDRLLASPRYAEKQAAHWLDAVRYADTAGFHGDNPFPVWPYRDYVLRAFHDNKPFDQFTREQIAGDLLPGATTEQKVASAYNRLNRVSAEGGIQPKEYLAKYAADRVRTASAVWLGSTTGCAECHDHKFDPFTAKDFYAFKAFYADIKETGLVPDRGPKAWGAQMPLPTPEQKRKQTDLLIELEDARCRLEEGAERVSGQQPAWETKVLADYLAGKLSWRYQTPLAATASSAALTIYNNEPVDGSFDFRGSLVAERNPGRGMVIASGPNPDNETYTVTFKPGPGRWTSLGIEVIQDDSLPGARLARGSDRFVMTGVEAEMPDGTGGTGMRLPFVLATTSAGNYPDTPAMAAIDGNSETGWGVSSFESRNAFLALRFAEPVETGPDTVITVRLKHESAFRRAVIGRFRVAMSSGKYSWPGTGTVGNREPKGNSGLPEEVAKALETALEDRTAEQREAVAAHFRWASTELAPLYVTAAQREAELAVLESGLPRVLVTESTEPAVTRILPRGNWMDETGEVVEPAIPAFLGKVSPEGSRATRLDLANWLVSPENPLTARVYANRTWRLFFGEGISKVLDDLGSQGEWPAHLELLDWLAAEFMNPAWESESAHPWDMKHLVRVIVTSHTYRQSSLPTPEIEAKDPDNRLLARQSRFRVDAEIIRDIALSVSGLLEHRFGGPSVKPYQPDGYLAALNFPKREYSTSRGADLYRRGLYTHWQRTFLHPTLATFDAPSREECAINRVNSNTPLQALVLLNDPIFVEAARVFAQNMVEEGGRDLNRRVDWAFRRTLGRAPVREERRILADLHQASLAHFRAAPEGAQAFLRTGDAPLPPEHDPIELAALATVARAILNLHETITRN